MNPLRSKPTRTRIRTSLRTWGPVVVWMGVIYWLSSVPHLQVLDVLNRSALWLAGAGCPGLAGWLERLGLAAPALSDLPGTRAYLVEFALRKTAHVAAYAVLAVLARRAAARTPVTAARPGLWAAAIAVLYAVSDELHQAAVLQRDGRLADVGIDAAGALLALALSPRGQAATGLIRPLR